ncbi:MAG: hypothetical protein ACK5LT_02335 [Lachnospirales bacterium]
MLEEFKILLNNPRSKVKDKDSLVKKVNTFLNKKHGKYFDVTYIEADNKCGFTFELCKNETLLAEEERLDGTFLIRSNNKKI